MGSGYPLWPSPWRFLALNTRAVIGVLQCRRIIANHIGGCWDVKTQMYCCLFWNTERSIVFEDQVSKRSESISVKVCHKLAWWYLFHYYGCFTLRLCSEVISCLSQLCNTSWSPNAYWIWTILLNGLKPDCVGLTCVDFLRARFPRKLFLFSFSGNLYGNATRPFRSTLIILLHRFVRQLK